MVVRGRRGFTIVEMLAVIGIIAVLMSIVVTAVLATIKSSRDKRAESMRFSLEQAIAAYYAQEGKWPSLIETADAGDKDTITFDGTRADQIFQEVVGKGFGRSGKKSMLIDVSALFVCDSGNANRKDAHGYEFSDVMGRHAKHRIDLDHMAFGYQVNHSNRKYDGCFRRFKVIYNCRTDAVKVEKDD